MAKFCPLFSSSSGNCIYIKSGSTHILVDAGVSKRKIEYELSQHGVDIDDISAIFVTHEHSDHIEGLGATAKKGIPVFATKKTIEGIVKRVPNFEKLNFAEIGETQEHGGISVERFETSHDCEGSSGYKFILPNGLKIAVCTDTGVMTSSARSTILGSQIVLIESNHDIGMLNNGVYPIQTKRRILSDKGHLSNNACAEELPTFLENGTTRFILGHISQKNNTPKLAKDTSVLRLETAGYELGSDYLLTVANPEGNNLMSF